MVQRLLPRRSVLLACALLLAGARPALADTFVFMWDLNTEPEVTGYIVHVGTQPGVYTQTIDVGMTERFVFSDAAPGQEYCFVVLAYAGSVRGFPSTEVCGISGSFVYLEQPAPQTSSVGQNVSLQLNASHSQDAPIAYTAQGLPPGLLLGNALGYISGVPTTVGVYTVTVTAAAEGVSARQTFTWTIQQANRAPALVNPGPQATDVGKAVSLALQGSDPDGTPLTYSAVGLPAGLTIAAASGQISGAPKTAGTYTVTTSVSDGSLQASQTFSWNVRVENVAPVLTTPADQATDLGEPASLQLVASDANGDTLSYAATGLPPGLHLSQSSGAIAGSPTAAGTYTVNVSVSDGTASASGSFRWTVRTVNDAPVLTNPGSQTADQGSFTVLNLQGSDPNGDPLTYGATGLPPGLQLTTSSGRIAGTPSKAGAYPVTASVSDGTLTVTQSFTWTVRAVNSAPVLTNPGSQTTPIQTSVALQLQATDADSDPLTYQASGLPPGLAISANTGLVSGLATTAGVYSVEVTVTDGKAPATVAFTWTIEEGPSDNDAPSLSNPGTQRSDVGTAVSLQLVARDPNDDPLTFSAGNVPPGLQLNPSSGVIAGVPTTAGTFSVTVSVSDGTASATRGFTWIIRDVNGAPTLTNPGARTNDAGDAVVLQLEASDPNGDTLTYSAAGLPPGLQIASGTGRITGIPTTPGTFSVTATASDGTATATQTFTWTIEASNAAPTLAAPGNQTTTAGQAATLQLQGADADGDTLTYSVTGLPAGLQVSAATGAISGTPGSPGTHTVTATVSDGQLSASRTFVWTVVAANVAPTLAAPGNQTATVGQSAVLQLAGADENGDTLAYTASGLPPGLHLNASSGLITGTPAAPGTYNVTASVTDGALSASRTFTWTVDLAPTAPELPSPGDQRSTAGVPVVLQLQATDANGDTLRYAAAGLPPGIRLSVSTGRISGTSTTVGTYPVSASVTDGTFTTSVAFTWTITPPNAAPTLAAPGNQTSAVGQAAVLQLQGSDPAGDTLSYSATGLPPGLQIDPATGRIAGTPTTAGTWGVTAVVSDGTLTARRSFTWTITAPSEAPVVAPIPPQFSSPGVGTMLQVQATDVNGGVLTYSAAGLPGGLQIGLRTGQISGTPSTVGIYPVTVTVSDGKLSTQASFTWTILPKKGGSIGGPPSSPSSAPQESRIYTGTSAAVRQQSEPVVEEPARLYTGSAARGRSNESTTTAPVAPPVAYSGAAVSRPSVQTTSANTQTETRAAAPRLEVEGTDENGTAGATPQSAVVRSLSTSMPVASETTGVHVTQQTTSVDTSLAVNRSSATVTAIGAAPAVSIETPVDHARFAAGATVIFSGVAHDAEDGALSHAIVWSSSVDGRLGTGAMFTRTLSRGTHIVTAQAIDSHGNVRRAQLTVLVE